MTMTSKEKIIQSAIMLFATEGYDGTSIQRLARVSGVGQGLLYRYYKSKDELLLHLVQTGIAQLGDTLLPYADKSLTFPDALRQHLENTFAMLKRHGLLWKVLHGIRHNTELMQRLDLGFDIDQFIITPISVSARRNGYQKSKDIAWLVFTVADGLTALHLLHPDIYPLERMKQLFTQQVMEYAISYKKS